MTRWLIHPLLALLMLTLAAPVFAAANLEINTPAISRLQASMQSRYQRLSRYFASGAVGLTHDGLVALRDASQAPLSQRQQVNALVAAENQDRRALYREIARANGHPEWEAEIQATFAQRWISKAPPGWWYQSLSGAWRRK
ncbi:MAG TPA: DUF1318 domain-containing protein [Betaproteobacteria bacterium]|nr:DUF1318 domain-containing protein [Betaproteobacteria bacterium]